jgi:hypothetical protein
LNARKRLAVISSKRPGMKRIRFAARIYALDGAEYTAGGYPTLRRAIRSAQAECEMIGGAKYHIHRWCPYTGYGEIVVGSDIAKNRLMRLAMLALGVTPWALVIVIPGVPT